MSRNEMIIKVCGMRDAGNIRQVAALGVDWIGMIFCDRSPRNVTMIPTNAGIIPDRANLQFSIFNLPCKRVGVFVDEMPQNIITRAVNFRLDILQLHGHEAPTLIRNLRATLDPDLRPGIKIMKAISVACRKDIEAWRDYADCVEYLLFDTKCPPQEVTLPSLREGSGVGLAGGTGQKFDWQLLDAYDGPIPFLLSGGIGPDDAERVKAFHHPRCIGIDLNSRFELEPALKDVDALQTFIANLK